MHLSTYLLLVGAAVLVTHLSGTDSYAIASKKVDESTETSADNERIGAALSRTSSSEDSAEEEEDDDVGKDSSEEKENKVKRSAQFSRNSDEFDNFSFEIDNNRRRPVGAAQPISPANVRDPVFRNSDERIDASDELRSVLASPVRPIVPTQTPFVNSDRLPLVPMSFRNPILARQQSNDDDISIEMIRDRVTPVIQQVVSTPTVTAGRLPAPSTGLRNPILVRQQSDDDFDDVSLEFVGQVAAPTPVRQVVATQTGLPNRLPVPMGFRNQLQVRESDGDLSLEVVRVSTPNQPTVPSQNSNPAANIRTAVFSQSDERDDVSVEIFGSLLNRNAGQLPAAPPAAQTSAIRAIQQANNRQQPIQTFNPVNSDVSARPVTRPQVQPPVTQATPTQAAVASSNRLPLVPMSFRNPILVRQQSDDDFDGDISIEIVDRVAPATAAVVQQVVATATSDRLPVPRDRNVFTGSQQVNRPAAANGQTGAPINTNGREFVVTQDADGDVSLELVSRVQSQQPAGVENQSVQQQGFSISPVRPLVPPRPVAVQTGNEGQRVNVFDDYSLEDNNDDDDDNDFFLEDGQFDNVDGFRLLASDFFAQPPGNGFPVLRSVENRHEAAQKDTQDRVEDNFAEPISLDDSDFHVVPAESDDWFLVKQYMDHDYSSEELEGELAKEYFWQPVKDTKRVKTEEDKMAELKTVRSQ